MNILELKESNCQNCYKCIRGCHIKAIEFKNNHANVIGTECILCGECIINCPQDAKYINGQLPRVQELVRSGRKVYATIAPSWSGYFASRDFEKLSGALKTLGFAGVEETAIGASEVSGAYSRLVEEGKMDNIIMTACSSVTMLIQRHFPKLIPYLAPVLSPMMAHAKLMKETYGDIDVVFIGPCFSKIFEGTDMLSGRYVDGVLTFSELSDWMDDAQIQLSLPDNEAVGVSNPVARYYPTPGGILKTMEGTDFGDYHKVVVDGLDRCIDLFRTISEDGLTGLLVEANICAGSCTGGPVMRLGERKLILAQEQISGKKQRQDERPAQTAQVHSSYPRKFVNCTVKNDMPSEEEIRRILAKTGKFTKEHELNCGSCGYNSCRDKAIAVYQGKADVNMCLPYFRNRAESISNTILANSPNAIFALDSELLVQDLNITAEEMFRINKSDCAGLPAEMYIDTDMIRHMQDAGERVRSAQTTYADAGITAEQTVVYVPEQNIYVVFIKDITSDVENEKELEKIRQDTIETTQKVIDKQMRVAQEIASLLGETTAETKVALTKLKKSLSETVV